MQERNNAANRWFRKPPRYVSASVLASTGGFLYGMDTGIIGPVTVMESWRDQFGHQPPIIHGVIVSSILISAAASSFYAGRPADRFGRPQAMCFGSIVSSAGVIIEGSSSNLGSFIAGRVVQGLGEGLFFGPIVTYICEISPPSQRGPLTTGPQLGCCAGLVVGYFVAYGTDSIANSLSWRLPFIVLAILTILWSVGVFVLLPQSPRWLLFRNCQHEIDAAWDTLDVKQEDRQQAIEEFQDVENSLAVEETKLEAADGESPGTEPLGIADIEHAANEKSYPDRDRGQEAEKRYPGWFDVFSPDVRLRTMLGVVLMSLAQLCGIDAVLYYAPLLFKQAGLESSPASFFASGVSGIVILMVSVPALLFADKWNRRASALVGGVGLTATMYLIGSIYAAGAGQSSARWVVVVCIYAYSVIFATTWGVSFKVYAVEIQPQRTRARATSLGYGMNWVCNFAVALICPVLLDKSDYLAYFLFGSITFVSIIICYIWMVETKGRSLDEIEADFQRRRRKVKLES